MELTFSKIIEQETSRRTILKYGTLAGISSLAGINLLNTGSVLPNINILENSTALSINNINSATNNSSINYIDYTTKPYNLFVVSENINLVNKLTADKRIANIYLYSKSINNGLNSKITADKSLSGLLLSLGAAIPFDYDITSLDMKAWKVREAFLYISEVYAALQNNSKSEINEEKLLSSINILGAYNRNIYGVNNHSAWSGDGEIIKINQASSPIGNIIML